MRTLYTVRTIFLRYTSTHGVEMILILFIIAFKKSPKKGMLRQTVNELTRGGKGDRIEENKVRIHCVEGEKNVFAKEKEMVWNTHWDRFLLLA